MADASSNRGGASPQSLNEFRKQIYGSNANYKSTVLGVRQSGKQSSLATANLHGRGSMANVSDASESKMGGFSKNKLKEESSIAKSSKDKGGIEDTNSVASSQQDSEESEVFVRTKAQAHHDHSSTDDAGANYETMKHNEQNIIASEQGAPIDHLTMSQQNSTATDQKVPLQMQTAVG